MEDKAKLISDLYKKKSEILSALSDLSNPEYYFVIGKGHRGLWIGGSLLSYSNLEEEFKTKVKEMIIAQYNRSIEKIEAELNTLLT